MRKMTDTEKDILNTTAQPFSRTLNEYSPHITPRTIHEGSIDETVTNEEDQDKSRDESGSRTVSQDRGNTAETLPSVSGFSLASTPLAGQQRGDVSPVKKAKKKKRNRLNRKYRPYPEAGVGLKNEWEYEPKEIK